jgi:outer membrane protein assembly factor BamB
LSNDSTAKPRGPRANLLVLPILVIAATTAVALIWIWSSEAAQRQEYVVKTVGTGLLACALVGLWVLVWILFLSGLRFRTRIAGVLLLAGLTLALAWSLEIRGVTGDVMPIVGWRWSAKPGTAAPALPSPIAGSGKVFNPASQPSMHDFPQFLGSRRDGTVTGVRLARGASQRPVLLWRQPIGAGWSSFAVSGGRAVTQEQRGETEAVTCYDARSGELIWVHTDATLWDDPLGGLGPRATPSIADGRVYTLGGTGLLNALDLGTGARIWSVDVIEDNDAEAPTYGVSASPLVLEEAVVVMAGGPVGRSVVAYDLATGRRLWAGGDDRAAYSSPVVADLAGRRQILGLSAENVFGHDAETGAPLWSHPWPPTEKVSQVTVLPGERVLLSSGYGVGAKLLQVEASGDGGFDVGPVWESQAMKAKFTNVVYRDGFVYGLDDGILACVDAGTGERRWKGGRYGHGQILLVEDLILVLGEKGTVVLVEASPEAHNEVASFAAIHGKTWNHPALAGRLLFVRNDREAACFELSGESI